VTTRDRILESADALFGEVGFDATTTRQIAEASGANKALIHYHFASKEALFHAVLERYYDRLDQVLRVVLEERGPVRERLSRLVDAYVDFLEQNRSFSRMVQREASGGRHVEPIAARMVPTFRGGVAVIQSAFPAARTGDLEAAQVLISFYGMIVTYFTYAPIVEALWDGEPFGPEALSQRKRHLYRMLELVLTALESDPTDDTRRP